MNENTNAVLMFAYVWFLILAWAVVTPVIAVIASLNSSYYLLWGTMLIVAGISFLVPVGSIYWRYRRLRIRGKSATATVTDYIKHTDSDGNDSYFPCFEFTIEGKVYNIQSRSTYSNHNPKYQTGDNVKIHYNPDDPQDAEIDDRFASSLMFVVMCIFIVVTVVGVLFVVLAEGFGEVFSKVWNLFF